MTHSPPHAPPKLAYLLSQYPAVSHTFFLSEIAALRERGFLIETASINPVEPPDDGFSPQELAERDRTYYVKSGAKAKSILRLLGIALRHPLTLQRGIREALRLAPGNIPATLYALFYLAEALLIGAWMRERGCRHLHVHFAGPVATVALLTSVAWRIPFSLTVHGPDEFYEVQSFHLTRKLDRAAFVLCISHFCRSQLLRIASSQVAGKLHVCRLGVDPELFAPLPRPPAESPRPVPDSVPDPVPDLAPDPVPRLISVGRLHPGKGHLVLLEAMEILKARGHRLTLDLIGGGPDRALIEQGIARRGLQQDVTLHGPISHARTRALLQQADLFVLASFAEGVPVALMEAMAMQIACVSTFVAGIPELIQSGVDGLLVPPSSTQDLADAIAALLDDPDHRAHLAAAGRAKVLANYNLAHNADRLADLLRGLGLGPQPLNKP